MKTSAIFYAALCVPAVMGRSMGAMNKLAGLLTIAEEIDKITQFCPDVTSACGDIITDVQTLIEGGNTNDNAAVQAIAIKLQNNPACVAAVTDCPNKISRGLFQTQVMGALSTGT